ncbi:hypothetical protein, partial [Deinococcus pimensis]|uniref:hypothetical protein n=1 Tax=Deinococcus pimensis TaxID=309888 RepID=UPI0005EB7CF8
AQIEVLRALLRARPALPSRDATLPYLPTAFAGQVLHGAVRFLDFPGGAGVRYLVAYSQEVAPLTRGQVFYTFQGLTRDGKYLVSLDHPVDVPFLPRDLFGAGVPARERDLLATLERGGTDVDAAYRAYTRDVARQLDALGASPALARLDAVARSVTLTAPKGR